MESRLDKIDQLIILFLTFEEEDIYIYIYIYIYQARKKVLVSQLCPTLCNLMDCISPGSSFHGIFQARKLE